VARKTETVVSYLDDLDGTKATETVSFSIDGVAYEIDLSAKNAKAIRADIAKWSESARKAKRTAGKPRRAASAKPSGEAAAIREWAAASGIAVPARGRIPKAIAEQYAAA
jgi:hypothetical protein